MRTCLKTHYIGTLSKIVIYMEITREWGVPFSLEMVTVILWTWGRSTLPSVQLDITTPLCGWLLEGIDHIRKSCLSSKIARVDSPAAVLTFQVTQHVLCRLRYQHVGLIILICFHVEISHHATSPPGTCTDADGCCQEIQAPAGVVALEDAAGPLYSCASIKATSYARQGKWE